MSGESSGRIHYIDVLKGIGIVFVVFGHCNSVFYGGNYVYSFHMVLFFFISGLLMNPGKYPTTREFFLSRVKQLYIPYLVFYLLRYFYWLAVERKMRFIDISPLDGILGLLWGSDNMHWIYPADVLWFVIGLMALELLFYFVVMLSKSWWLRVFLLALLTAVGLLLAKYKLYVLPFSLNNVLIVIPFFTAGFLLRKPLKESDLILGASRWRLLLSLSLPLLFTIWKYPWICELGKQTDISYLNHPAIYWFYTVPFIEIALWLLVSALIERNRIAEWLGRNTLPILAFHSPVGRILIYGAGLLWGISKSEIKGEWGYSLLLTAASVLCCVPIVYVWNWLYPRLVSHLFRAER